MWTIADDPAESTGRARLVPPCFRTAGFSRSTASRPVNRHTAILTRPSPEGGSITPAAAAAAAYPSHLSRQASSSSHLKPCRSAVEALGLHRSHGDAVRLTAAPATERLDLRCCRQRLLKTEPPIDATRRLMILNPVATTTPHNVSGNADCCHTLSDVEEQSSFQFVIKSCWHSKKNKKTSVCSIEHKAKTFFAFKTANKSI